jgi:hypothetical protein
MMATDPAMVVFDTNPSSTIITAGSELLLSWRDGPVKMMTFSQRGRPRKGL